jgi:recombination protein RecR
MYQQLPSSLLEKAVGEFSKLPGIGRKTALRLVLFLLRQPVADVEVFTEALAQMRREVKYCKVCHNISDTDVCPICADNRRDRSQVCVVENVQDVMAVENTQQYRGLYHVLGGVISPVEGIGPSDLQIDSLVERVAEGQVEEVILATNPDVEGETTATYLARTLQPLGVVVSRLASGLPVGGDLEYADEVTLLKAVEGRREL